MFKYVDCCLTTLPVAECIKLRPVILINLQIGVKEGTVAKFTLLSRRLSGSTEDNHGKPQGTIMAENGTGHLQSTTQKFTA